MVDNVDTNQMDVNIDFSRAELLDILRFLELPAFLGVDVAAANDMAAAQRDFMYELARNALVARKVMARDAEGAWRLDPLVLTLIATCAVPRRSVIVTHQRPQRPSAGYFFHTGERVTVLHKVDSPEIHEFYLLRSPRPISTALGNVLQIDDAQAAECPPAQLPEALMTQARDAALQSGAAEAAAILETAGVDAETSRQLARTLAQPTAFTTIAHIVHQSESNGSSAPEQDGFTVLHGAGLLWLARPQVAQSGDVAAVTVAPIGAASLMLHISELVSE